jgi:four helix bundle protein
MFQMHLSKLRIWVRAMEVTEEIYQHTRTFPKEELYGITSQVRRAAVSIPSNIAEGSQRTSDKDFAHFVLIAKGSLAELQTQLILCRNFSYLSEDDWKILQGNMEELHRMLHSFHSKLVARSS